ncbi:MAG TPA: MFS transporter [Actinospica sp.]|nr:MFS transporter [Actinospica sp.]
MLNRNFTLIWISQALSDTASEMTSLALPLAVLAATRSVVDASLVATAVAIAQLTFRLPAGLIADMFNRKHLMLWCDAVRAAVALLLALALASHNLTTILAVGAAAVTAAGSTVFAPAEGGLLRQSVPRELRREAITRNVVRTNLAIAVGPPLGGLLLGLGAPLAFVADAATYVLSFLMVAQVAYQRLLPPERESGDAPGGAVRRTVDELTRGFSWLRHRRALLMQLAIAAYVNLLGRAIELLAAISASDLGRHPVSAGVVLTAAGCGGIVGGLCTGWILRHVRPAWMIAGGAATWLVLMPLAAVDQVAVAVVAVGLVVFSLPPLGSLVFLTVNTEVPPYLQGRVSTTVMLLAGSIAWAGPGITGFLIASCGAIPTALILVSPLLIPLLALLLSPSLRRAMDPVEPEPNEMELVTPTTGTGR